MIRQPISFAARVGLGLASVLVIVGAYAVLSHRQHVVNPKDTTIPTASQFVTGWQRMLPKSEFPDRIFHGEQWADYIEGSWLLSDFLATYGRLLYGLLWGILLSLLVGMAMGCFPAVEAFFTPPLSFFAKIPPTAMLAVYFVVFGTEVRLFVAMIALGIFPTLAQAIYQAAKKDVTDHAVYKAYTLGASHLEVIWNVVFQQDPAADFRKHPPADWSGHGVPDRRRVAGRRRGVRLSAADPIAAAAHECRLHLSRHPGIAAASSWTGCFPRCADGSARGLGNKWTTPTNRLPTPWTSNTCAHWFGSNRVLNDVDFVISPGQIVSVVGPSGCGKSTLLRAILGTHPPKKGEIWTERTSVTSPTPGRRDRLSALQPVRFPHRPEERGLRPDAGPDELALPRLPAVEVVAAPTTASRRRPEATWKKSTWATPASCIPTRCPAACGSESPLPRP